MTRQRKKKKAPIPKGKSTRAGMVDPEPVLFFITLSLGLAKPEASPVIRTSSAPPTFCSAWKRYDKIDPAGRKYMEHLPSGDRENGTESSG